MRINMKKINVMRINILICMIVMYIKNLCNICKKYIMWFTGYTRIYDIDRGVELTYDYYVMRIISLLGRNIYEADVIKKIGVCGNAKGKPVKYVLRDKTINQVFWTRTETESELRLIKNHEISKITLWDNDSRMNIDVTDAKRNFHEIEETRGIAENEKISDMIKLHLLSRGIDSLRSMDAMIVRKIFDDETIRYIDRCEIININ
jgi:hypothetical protein